MGARKVFRQLAVAEVRRIEERIRTVHERVDCPACHAPAGMPCRALPYGYRGELTLGDASAGGHLRHEGRPLKHAHRSRLTADGIALR